MAIYLLNADSSAGASDNLEQKLRALIPDLINVTDIETALQNTARRPETRSCVLVVAPAGDKAHVAALTNIAARYRDHMFFILIGGELSAGEYKSLVRTGGAE